MQAAARRPSFAARSLAGLARRAARVVPALLTMAAGAACASHAPDVEGYPAACYPDAPTACPSTPPSWSAEVEPIIETTCALGGQCHGAGGAEEAMYDFTTYAGVKQDHVTMNNQVAGCLMPPAGAAAPSHADWLTLLEWFQCGAPQN